MEAGRSGLTLGEARMARLIAEGRTDEEIAARLGVRAAEVDSALVGILRKLGVQSRTELALLIAPSMPPEDAAESSEPTPWTDGHSEGSATP